MDAKKKHSGSALRAWIRGRYDVRVKRPRRELVPRRLTSALEDMIVSWTKKVNRSVKPHSGVTTNVNIADCNVFNPNKLNYECDLPLEPKELTVT